VICSTVSEVVQVRKTGRGRGVDRRLGDSKQGGLRDGSLSCILDLFRVPFVFRYSAVYSIGACPLRPELQKTVSVAY
jgi:hypothetical protein